MDRRAAEAQGIKVRAAPADPSEVKETRPSTSVDPELQAEVRQELHRMLMVNRSTMPLGAVAVGLVVTALSWPFLPHGRLLGWLVGCLAAAGLQCVCLYGPLSRRIDRRGLPMPAQVVWPLVGVTFGSISWVAIDRLDEPLVAFLCLPALFAVAAGTQSGTLAVTPLVYWLQGPMWGVVVPAYLVAGQWVLALGMAMYVGFVFKDNLLGRRLVVDGVAARVRSQREAVVDPLTGLANRAGLMTAVLRAVEGEPDRTLSMLFIDLDRFKQVNDRFGHGAGDGLLRQVAERLQACLRPGDLVGRIGGDEFVALVLTGPGVPPPGERLAARMIEELERPFAVHGHQMWISASVGVTSAPVDEVDPERLLTEADRALYQAKRGGRRQAVPYRAELGSRFDQQSRLEMELRRALAGWQIEAWAQPVVDVPTARIAGFELLARWTLLDGTPVSPAEFVPLAEEVGLIRELDRLMLTHAVRLSRRWAAHPRLARHHLAVNISGLHVTAGLVDDLDELVPTVGAGCPLMLEITEQSGLTDEAQAVEVLRRVADRGIDLALDDFGVGFSSIRALTELPVSVVKLDRSIVAGLTRGDQGRDMVRAACVLATVFGHQVVAEGIETAAELAAVRELGIQRAQGYGLGRPLPADEVETRLDDLEARVRSFCAEAGIDPGPEPDVAAEPAEPEGLPPRQAGVPRQG